MRKAEGLGDVFVFLSDLDGEAAADFAGAYDAGFLKPATFVFDKAGFTSFEFEEANFKDRPHAQDVLDAVKAALNS